MKVSGQSSANEAVLEWLKAELDSPRFGADLRDSIKSHGYDRKIITEAKLDNDSENKARWHILKSYRSWLDRDFGEYDWEHVELNREDVNNLKYVDYSYWNELSDGTRKVGTAARNLAKGKVVFDVSNDGFFSIAKKVEAGTPLPSIIIVSDPKRGPAEILEGHMRATGYLLAKQSVLPLSSIWGRLRS